MAETRQITPLLSAWIREATEAGRQIPEINSRNIDAVESTLPAYSVSQKQLLLIRALARKSKFPGDSIQLVPEYDFPLAWAANEDELIFYLRTREQRGLIGDTSEGAHTLDEIVAPFNVTSNGWEYLDEHSRQSPLSDQVFVAMSFSDELKLLWLDAIAPAIDEAGYKPYRVDSEPHVDRIDAKIVAEIRNSKFVVADVTEHKLGVYFEAGYALGLGLPVIWTVREDELAKTHFDTRQYNHIVWSSPSELKEKLYLVICAVIGKNR
jgi:nucleoside 2-deoxyribosyltransferase